MYNPCGKFCCCGVFCVCVCVGGGGGVAPTFVLCSVFLFLEKLKELKLLMCLEDVKRT